ncbi:hypothetical protein M9M90_08600 [Phenylobacterium sp. LH3H17]|uniref:hypothetical protein n=1 Tax=Phenylobacterium sp. LH3H17 TaxID=2903901 RepID=UPI0020C9B7ED|nr:hypothetical protein [Phenylobacterium sp. LH3H17]UTP41221.1 hypothetical protein M9M90_08600 [Phenylobacterium sp. LH3H17]
MIRTDLPKLARPAQRALAGVGVTCLEDLAEHTEIEIAALHGLGPNALGCLKEALAAMGLDFKVA